MSEKTVNPKDFAIAVIGANPVAGESADEKAGNALELYLAAVRAADEHNKGIKSNVASSFIR